VKIRRRLSGLVTVLALAHFSFGGLLPGHAPRRDTPRHAMHTSGGVPTVVQADDASCDSDRVPCCDAFVACATMSSCLGALACGACAPSLAAAVSDAAAVLPLDVALDPSRAPEPPPPRV